MCYNMAMNEVVKYHNKLNKVVFKDFTDAELRLFFAVVSRLREKGTGPVTFTFSQLRELTGEKRHFTIKEYVELFESMYDKIMSVVYSYDDGVDKAGKFYIFTGYERSINEQTFTISVTPQYAYYFNSLTSQFTRFELIEFVNLKGIHTKHLYRLLKQFRQTGYFSAPLKELKQLLDVPEKYQTKYIVSRVIQPSVDKLRELPAFRDLCYDFSYAGNKIIRVKFSWMPESKFPENEKIPLRSDPDEWY